MKKKDVVEGKIAFTVTLGDKVKILRLKGKNASGEHLVECFDYNRQANRKIRLSLLQEASQ
jgi:hypothetical protein